MKKTLLISLVLFLNQSFAQDYRIGILNDSMFYSDLSMGISVYNLNESPIKVMYFDSTFGSSQDTSFYSFSTWRDTSFGDTCLFLDGPTWIGWLKADNSGMNTIVSIHGDTTYYNTQANINDTWVWTYDRIYNGQYIATVDSLVWMTYAGITDSVKCISLSYYDSTSTLDTNYLSGRQIFISKSNGIFKFQQLWNMNEIIRIENIPMTTWAEVYDFNIGDEFEYENKCTDFFGGNTNGVDYTYRKITNKWFSVALDTVFYEFLQGRRSIYHFTDTIYPPSSDTLSYAIDNTPLYTTFPEENILSSSLNYIDSYNLRLLGKLPAYSNIWGYMNGNLTDSCFTLINFEPLYFMKEFGKGLGQTIEEFNAWSQASTDCIEHLIWYKKGADTWGGYVSVFTGIDELAIDSKIFVYPNPFSKSITINTPFEKDALLKVTDLTGKLLLSRTVKSSATIDLDFLAKGIYVLSLQNDGAVYNRKIVKN